MGYRLSKIYTRTGDKGMTALGDGTRINKDDARIEAYGTVDELNSAIGLILAHENLPNLIKRILAKIQHELFDLGAELSIPGKKTITESHTKHLEKELDTLNAELSPLKEFILPGGHPAAASCHLARTICRRAERRVVTLSRQTEINQQGLIYLNRLSDLLFVIARAINKETNHPETFWQHERS